MNFTNYTDKPVKMAIDLINTWQLPTGEDTLTSLVELKTFARKYTELNDIKEDDLSEVHILRQRLREVFVTSDELEAATTLNNLLEHYGAIPRISWHGGPLHLHFEAIEQGFVRWLGAATAMGLTVVLCDYGKERLGICASKSCQKAFVDISKNRRKIYCSEACAHRESMAAYRERQRSSQY